MNDSAERSDERPSAGRGEAAWKEATARIAARNDKARKEGRARRDAYEAEKAAARLLRERRRMEALMDKRRGP